MGFNLGFIVAFAGNYKDVAELSNFLGTIARDNVSLTYVNWHDVPDQLKQKLWEYTLVISILYEYRLHHFLNLCIQFNKT